MLEIADSSYLKQFKVLQEKIEQKSIEATDNETFLMSLQEPCKKIENSEPCDIPKILPDVLNAVRLIWEMSKYYNTPECMKNLLTKISN